MSTGKKIIAAGLAAVLTAGGAGYAVAQTPGFTQGQAGRLVTPTEDARTRGDLQKANDRAKAAETSARRARAALKEAQAEAQSIDDVMTQVQGLYDAIKDAAPFKEQAAALGQLLDTYKSIGGDDVLRIIGAAFAPNVQQIQAARADMVTQCDAAQKAQDGLYTALQAVAPAADATKTADNKVTIESALGVLGPANQAVLDAQQAVAQCTGAGERLTAVIQHAGDQLRRGLFEQAAPVVPAPVAPAVPTGDWQASAAVGYGSVNGGVASLEAAAGYGWRASGVSVVGVARTYESGAGHSATTVDGPNKIGSPLTNGFYDEGTRTTENTTVSRVDHTLAVRAAKAFRVGEAFQPRVSVAVGVDSGHEAKYQGVKQDTQLFGPDGKALGKGNHLDTLANPEATRNQDYTALRAEAGVGACYGSSAIKVCVDGALGYTGRQGLDKSVQGGFQLKF